MQVRIAVPQTHSFVEEVAGPVGTAGAQQAPALGQQGLTKMVGGQGTGGVGAADHRLTQADYGFGVASLLEERDPFGVHPLAAAAKEAVQQ